MCYIYVSYSEMFVSLWTIVFFYSLYSDYSTEYQLQAQDDIAMICYAWGSVFDGLIVNRMYFLYFLWH